jgi:uncharacterized protein YukE
MSFEMPDAVTAMSEALAAAGGAGDSWDVIGKPLDPSIEKAAKYDASVPAKREELGELHWGRIEADVARLHGLAAAIDNVSSVVRKGKEALAHDWSGKSYDAFRAAIERVERTLNDYSAAAKATADGLGAALTSIRTQYQSYVDNSLRILAFDQVPGEESDTIGRRIGEWHRATETLKAGVGRAYRAALDNLRVLAEDQTFATMTVPGVAVNAATGAVPGVAVNTGAAPAGVSVAGSDTGITSAGSDTGTMSAGSDAGATSAAGYEGPSDFGGAGSAALGQADPLPHDGPGEASLASASDDGSAGDAQSASGQDQGPQGAAGGLPMLGGIVPGKDAGRAGSAWRVQGDLFADPAGAVLEEEGR